MNDILIQEKLRDLYEHTQAQAITESSKIVVFSDLHMGNGSRTDDFRRNSELFSTVLGTYHISRGFSLVLNGDIEELHRFRLRTIQKQWQSVYATFEDLQRRNRLIKIVGNHDHELYTLHPHSYPLKLVPAVKYRFGDNFLFIVHGHQASGYFDRWNTMLGFLLRYFVNPLKIKSRTVAHDSDKKFNTELRLYEFSSKRRIITLIGHTHRPLFESHSMIDDLKFKIENHLRSYAGADPDQREAIEEEVSEYRRELSRLYEKHEISSLQSNLYNQLIVPSLFNSGCVIGKRGITCLEIENGRISLVHWFDENTSVYHLKRGESDPVRLEGTGIYRTVLKSEPLSYIFARISLLA